MPRKIKTVQDLQPVAMDDEDMPKKKKKAKAKPKPKPMKLKKGRAGSYLTTRGQKQRILDDALDYTLE